MGKFFADLDGTTKAEFSIGGESTFYTAANGGFVISQGGSLSAGMVQAYSTDDFPNHMGGGIMLLAGSTTPGMQGSDYGVKLVSRPTMTASYALKFPETAPAAGQVQLMVAQGENLSFVPLATLAAGAVKIEKKLISFDAPATTPWLTLPAGAEIWRLRIAIVQRFQVAASGVGATPKFTLGATGNLNRYLDLTLGSYSDSAFSADDGAIIEQMPREMGASEIPLVIGFTPNGATAGQAALYCEYMIPNL